MNRISAKNVTDLVHQLNDLGKLFIDNLPLYNIVEVGGESFELEMNWNRRFSIITKVNDDDSRWMDEYDYIKIVTGYSTNKKLVVGVNNSTGNFYSFIHGYNGKVFDAFFYDGLIESLKKSLLLSVFYDRVTSIRKIHRRTLEIAGHMGDEDASVLAQYAYSR